MTCKSGEQFIVLGAILIVVSLCLIAVSTALWLYGRAAPHGEKFAVIGDVHLPESDFDEAWVEAINASGAKRLFVLGDVVCGADWREGWARFDQLAARLDMPVEVVCGNHDVETSQQASYFRERFGADYFAFEDAAGTRYVVLNTELEGAERDAMLLWLAAELQQPCARRYVFCHKPLPEISGADRTLPGQPDIEALVETGGVDMVFSGHWHYFHQIDRPRYVQVISGGGGNGLLRHDRAEGEKVSHFLLVNDGMVECRVVNRE